MKEHNGRKILKSIVDVDDFTKYASKAFDYDFTGESTFICHKKPNIKHDFNIGLIVGSSGSGKSTLLKEFGEEEKIGWDNNKAIISHFNEPDSAVNLLCSVGLSSVPAWMKPYYVLSTGERFRADLARKLKDNAVIDEFTSVVNRSVAKSASVAISKMIRRNNIKNVVLCSCHDDIIDWLDPDWIFNTDTGEYIQRGSLRQRPIIRVDIYGSTWKNWEMFKKHHYLTSDINRSAVCHTAVYDNIEVGFMASLAMPNKIPPLYPGDNRNKYRGHRAVVLPDYQGLGIGVKFIEGVAELFLDNNIRFFSKTAYIKVGNYMNNSRKWRKTSRNMSDRRNDSCLSNWHNMALDTKRICYSHEYIGDRVYPE